MVFYNPRAARWARLCGVLALAVSLWAYTASITADRKAALDRISAQSMQGHIWFLASDLLEGRDTPSRGLDIAAEYIAAQFRRAGLKPAGDDGYFQTARYVISEQSADGAEFTVNAGDKDLQIGKNDLRIVTPGKADFSGVTPVKVKLSDVSPDAVEGKVIVIAVERRVALEALRKLKPSAALLAYSNPGKEPEVTQRLQDLERRGAFPILRVHNREFYKLVEAAKPGPMDAKLSLRLPPPIEKPVSLRNVAGLLPGSDPTLADTYVLISAHYDHLGKKPSGEGDLIYNGANDDASGVAAVLEMAAALSGAKPGPRRSVLFITYFGEEKGLLGSLYYGRHPLFPLKKTVADLNLEHLGRTDGENSKPAGTATMTGFGYSDISTAFEMAGAATGVKIYSPEKNGDAYFARSDNQSLADQGVPAHTFLTTFEFPDYHKVGDEWDKIDYANLEKVTRTIALTVMMIADDPQPPHWNESNPKTEKYVKAWRELK
jgi:peptidase M28-like protein